jgi:DNA topoisomerase VI subunit B
VGGQTTFKRETFTRSRESEYFNRSELETQTGHTADLWWPELVAKELLDNALDACEDCARAPVISVRFDSKLLEVEDNAKGIPAKTVKDLMYFQTRTGDKQAYVSPTRGAMGNALKCALTIPFELAGHEDVTIEIDARGVNHRILVSSNEISGRADVSVKPLNSARIEGSRLRIPGSTASVEEGRKALEFLQKLVQDYSLFNPHSVFVLNGERFEATNPRWQKWKTKDQPVAHWYDVETLAFLVSCLLDKHHNKPRTQTIGEFVAQFRGLSDKEKLKQITGRTALGWGAVLEDLVTAGNKVDRAAVGRMLGAMKEYSKSVKPERLGKLGEDHFRARIAGSPGALPQTFRYRCEKGLTEAGLPFLAEVASVTTDGSMRGFHIGLNYAVPLENPIPNLTENLFWRHDVHPGHEPLCVVVHLATPRFIFTDKAKVNVRLGNAFAGAVDRAVRLVTRPWAEIKKAEETRNKKAEREARKRYMEAPKPKKVTDKEVIFKWLPSAYDKASDGGRLYISANSVYYARRAEIYAEIGEKPKNEFHWRQRFIYVLLREYRKLHPEETKDWRIYYDPRGKLIEPHTGMEVPLGTQDVDEYLALPGPRAGYYYGGILYCEKSTHVPLLKDWGIEKRYDLALAHSVGVGNVSLRVLLSGLTGKVRIFVLHDFDKAGFVCAGILKRDTKAHHLSVIPEVIDLGLRLEDVKEWKLETEDVDFGKSDPRGNLKENGALAEQIEFLCRGKDAFGHYVGRRAELNAFTGADYIKWLEGKLEAAGVEKLVPDDKVIEPLYLTARQVRLDQLIVDRQARLDALTAERQAKRDAKVEARRQEIRRKIHDRLWRDFLKAHGKGMAKLSKAENKEDARARKRVKPAKPLKPRKVKPLKATAPQDLRDRVAADLKKHRGDLWTEAVRRVEATEPLPGVGPKPETASLDLSFIEWRESHEPVSKEVQ